VIDTHARRQLRTDECCPTGRGQRGGGLGLVALGVVAVGFMGFAVWQFVRAPAASVTGADRASGSSPITQAEQAPRTHELPEPAAPAPSHGQRTDLMPQIADAEEPVTVGTPTADTPVLRETDSNGPKLQERLAALRRGNEPAVRLDAARQILALGPDAPLLGMALDVLAELEPQSLVPELQRLASMAASDPGSGTGLAAGIRTLSHREGAISDGELTALYDTGAASVQVAAAASLALRGDETLVDQLVSERSADLAHGSASVRAAAVSDLAATSVSATLPTVLPLLSDESAEVRLAVLNAVRFSDDLSMVDRVRPLLDDPDEHVATAARRMVQRMANRLERARAGQLPGGPRGDGR